MNSFVRSRSRSGSGGPQELVKPAGSPTVASLRRSPSDPDSLCVIEERLGSLCDALSQDVLPGLERELGQVRGWIYVYKCCSWYWFCSATGDRDRAPGLTCTRHV